VEPQAVTLSDLMAEARSVVGPDRPVTPLVMVRLRQRRPEDAAAARDMAKILGRE
jgi:hypothetical protein